MVVNTPQTKPTQRYCPILQIGDIVSMADGKHHMLGIFKGYGKAGNYQVDFGWSSAKGILSSHSLRLVKVCIADLPQTDQEKLQKIINKYKNYGTNNGQEGGDKESRV